MRKINQIIIHCSDSSFGNVEIIRDWHVKGNGWDDIGYHYVITNGCDHKNAFSHDRDGAVELGRPIDVKGSHCYGHNSDSIGVCLIGIKDFTNQQYESLKKLCVDLMARFNIPLENIKGHCEYNSKKTCPNINPDFIREIIGLKMEKK